MQKQQHQEDALNFFDQFLDQNFKLSTKLIFKVCAGCGTNPGSFGFLTYFFSLYQWDTVISHYPSKLKRTFYSRSNYCGVKIRLNVCVWQSLAQLTENISLEWKWLKVANTLAYKDMALIYKISPFVIWPRCRSSKIKKIV